MSEAHIKALCQQINDPKNLNSDQICDLVMKICQYSSQKALDIQIDENSYCSLSGELIGDQETVELKILDEPKRVLKIKLRELIQEHCFWDDIFEWSFAKIHNIKFINYKTTINIDIDNDILLKVYGEKEYETMMKKVDQFYEQSEKQTEELKSKLYFTCPKTNKEFSSLIDGFNIQSKYYSLDGAVKVLEEQKDVLFPHQIEFLNAYQIQRA